MSARDELIEMGWYYYAPDEPCEEWADAIIAKISHELAEKIREQAKAASRPGSQGYAGMFSAANLIDPETE